MKQFEIFFPERKFTFSFWKYKQCITISFEAQSTFENVKRRKKCISFSTLGFNVFQLLISNYHAHSPLPSSAINIPLDLCSSCIISHNWTRIAPIIINFLCNQSKLPLRSSLISSNTFCHFLSSIYIYFSFLLLFLLKLYSIHSVHSSRKFRNLEGSTHVSVSTYEWVVAIWRKRERTRGHAAICFLLVVAGQCVVARPYGNWEFPV